MTYDQLPLVVLLVSPTLFYSLGKDKETAVYTYLTTCHKINYKFVWFETRETPFCVKTT